MRDGYRHSALVLPRAAFSTQLNNGCVSLLPCLLADPVHTQDQHTSSAQAQPIVIYTPATTG